ncbi:MAG: RNA methyltransferase, partial [Eubacteriales bacterium]|nr:RNA methyltransferase [Eubacteriales bacterium]
LPVFMAETPGQVIRLLKQYQKTVICTSPSCSRYYYEADLKENAAVIIGNEGNGVCDEFMKGSDLLIKIPMEGTIESLNAAVSAGILMYESVRQKKEQ